MTKRNLLENIDRMKELLGIKPIEEGLFDFLNKKEQPKQDSIPKQGGYLKDIPKDIAYDIFKKNIPDEAKHVLADVIKSLDNQFIAQSLHRWIQNTAKGIDTVKLGTRLSPLPLSKEQSEYIISKMHELHSVNQKQKDNLKNMIKGFINEFPIAP